MNNEKIALKITEAFARLYPEFIVLYENMGSDHKWIIIGHVDEVGKDLAWPWVNTDDEILAMDDDGEFPSLYPLKPAIDSYVDGAIALWENERDRALAEFDPVAD